MLKKIDHLVITTADPSKCLPFYEALGFEIREDGACYALFAGDFKINVHVLGHEIAPHAAAIQPGSADLCFEVEVALDELLSKLARRGIHSETGPVRRHGVRGEMRSFYLRDPDGNLIELCDYAGQS